MMPYPSTAVVWYPFALRAWFDGPVLSVAEGLTTNGVEAYHERVSQPVRPEFIEGRIPGVVRQAHHERS